MKALVVFESLYGNTAAVGEAIAASLRGAGVQADIQPVDRADPQATGEIDLLVVGGPTHVHGMSREATRKAGAEDEKNPGTYAEPTIAPGLREWLEQIPPGAGSAAAAFDTRIDKPAWITGSAAKGIGKRLRHGGFRLIADPESFLVTTANALVEGELQHAERWGASLAASIPTPDLHGVQG